MSTPKEAISELQPQLATRTPLHEFIPGEPACLAQPADPSCHSLVSGPTNSEVLPPCFGSQCESAKNGDPSPSNLSTGGAKKQKPKALQKQVDKET